MAFPAVWTSRRASERARIMDLTVRRPWISALVLPFSCMTGDTSLASLSSAVLTCKVRMICKMVIGRRSDIQNTFLPRNGYVCSSNWVCWLHSLEEVFQLLQLLDKLHETWRLKKKRHLYVHGFCRSGIQSGCSGNDFSLFHSILGNSRKTLEELGGIIGKLTSHTPAGWSWQVRNLWGLIKWGLLGSLFCSICGLSVVLSSMAASEGLECLFLVSAFLRYMFWNRLGAGGVEGEERLPGELLAEADSFMTWPRKSQAMLLAYSVRHCSPNPQPR